MNVGDNILRIREQKGITRKELAEALNVSLPSITRYEKAYRDITTEKIIKIAAALNVSPSELFVDQSSPNDCTKQPNNIAYAEMDDLELFKLFLIEKHFCDEHIDVARLIKIKEKVESYTAFLFNDQLGGS